jgi:hypothetical protein
MEWLGGIVAGAIAGYLLEFTRPWVIAFFIKGKLTWREKRIAALVQEHKKIQRFRTDKFRLIIILLNRIMHLVALGIVLVVEVGSFLIEHMYFVPAYNKWDFALWYGAYIFIVGVMFYRVISFNGVVRKVLHYPEYRGQTIAKIKKLGGNPEDLDILAIEESSVLSDSTP